MSHPRVLWYHLILTAYGFWLPNDPRGSWSIFVGSWELYKFGPATKTSEKRSLAREMHDREARLAAKAALKHPPVGLTNRNVELSQTDSRSRPRKADTSSTPAASDMTMRIWSSHDTNARSSRSRVTSNQKRRWR